MTPSTRTIYSLKKEHLQDMLDRLVNWDQSVDSAQDVLDQNQATIEDIIELDKNLSSDEMSEFTENNRQLIEQVISVQEQLITIIKTESHELSKQMKQVNKRDKVVSHYMDKEESLFVDREV